MTLTEIRATMNYLVAEAERDQAARRSYREMDKDGYKWILSPDVVNELEINSYAHCISPITFKITHCYGLPVQIDYQAREKIELWRKLGD